MARTGSGSPSASASPSGSAAASPASSSSSSSSPSSSDSASGSGGSPPSASAAAAASAASFSREALALAAMSSYMASAAVIHLKRISATTDAFSAPSSPPTSASVSLTRASSLFLILAAASKAMTSLKKPGLVAILRQCAQVSTSFFLCLSSSKVACSAAFTAGGGTLYVLSCAILSRSSRISSASAAFRRCSTFAIFCSIARPCSFAAAAAMYARSAISSSVASSPSGSIASAAASSASAFTSTACARAVATRRTSAAAAFSSSRAQAGLSVMGSAAVRALWLPSSVGYSPQSRLMSFAPGFVTVNRRTTESSPTARPVKCTDHAAASASLWWSGASLVRKRDLNGHSRSSSSSASAPNAAATSSSDLVPAPRVSRSKASMCSFGPILVMPTWSGWTESGRPTTRVWTGKRT